MRQAFNVGVVVILALLLANRAVTRLETHGGNSVTCAQASLLVKAEALARGFSATGARTQGENFLSSCLVSGEGQVGGLTAHD